MNSSFRTEFSLPPGYLPSIDYLSSIFLLGSCFSESMAGHFQAARFKKLGNPFGVTYNPISINVQLQRIVKKQLFVAEEFKEVNGLFVHPDLHGSCSNPLPERAIEYANERLNEAHSFLIHASHVFITPGTAWVYELKENEKIVNNCHKLGAQLFRKRLLMLDEIITSMRSIEESIKQLNPSAHVIFTLSPVRHLKDGFEENSISKALLRLGIEEVRVKDKVYYFPSYEIIMDDLRDYRFFKEDLVHPNEMALEYLWNQLKRASMNDDVHRWVSRLENFNRSLQHRTMHKGSPSHHTFLKNLIDEAEKVMAGNPAINLNEDLEILRARLSSE